MKPVFPDSCLVQFARAPEMGRVKTRLQPVLGESGCLALHRALVAHVFESIRTGGLAHQELWCSEHHPFFAQLTDATATLVRCQCGTDLGARMAHAFADRLVHYRKVILIGSDCPALGPSYLKEALLALDESPVVLGPATDGGYVLIGLTGCAPQLFSDIPWGTEHVMSATRQRLIELGLRWRELEAMSDIDRPEDLRRLPAIGKLKKFADIL